MLDSEPIQEEFSVQLFPRRQKGSASSSAASVGTTRQSGAPLVLTKQDITGLFSLSQPDAAARLGVSITSLKKVCRKMDIVRWPFRRKLGLVTSPTAWNVQDAMRCDSKAVTATSNHGMAFHSGYSTISKCGASKLQKMTKPRAEASKTMANYTVELPFPRAQAKVFNVNRDSDSGSQGSHGELVNHVNMDLLNFYPNTTQSHFPGCVPASVTAAATSVSLFTESCRRSFVKAGNIEDDLRRDSCVFCCKQAQDYRVAPFLSPRVEQLKASQVGQTVSNSKVLNNWNAHFITDESDGERQAATAMEDNSDNLHWLVCATSPLLNDNRLCTSQNHENLAPASSSWGSLQSLDLPSTLFLNDLSSTEGQPHLESWAPTWSPCQPQPELKLLCLHHNAV